MNGIKLVTDGLAYIIYAYILKEFFALYINKLHEISSCLHFHIDSSTHARNVPFQMSVYTSDQHQTHQFQNRSFRSSYRLPIRLMKDNFSNGNHIDKFHQLY